VITILVLANDYERMQVLRLRPSVRFQRPCRRTSLESQITDLSRNAPSHALGRACCVAASTRSDSQVVATSRPAAGWERRSRRSGAASPAGATAARIRVNTGAGATGPPPVLIQSVLNRTAAIVVPTAASRVLMRHRGTGAAVSTDKGGRLGMAAVMSSLFSHACMRFARIHGQQLVEMDAVQQLHGEEGQVSVAVELIYANDIGMRERLGQVEFLQQRQHDVRPDRRFPPSGRAAGS
jgi:hypothetical protein